MFFVCLFITYRRWGQSTSNVAHPACGHKGSTHLSPVHAYEFLSRCRFSTPTPRQPMIEVFVLASSRFPLRKSEEKFTSAESRTLKFRLSGRNLYPVVHGGSALCHDGQLSIPFLQPFDMCVCRSSRCCLFACATGPAWNNTPTHLPDGGILVLWKRSQ